MHPKIILTVLAALLSGTVAFADDVRIRTQFPSPYGTYGTLTVQESASFATGGGDTQIAVGGGRVTIGVAAADRTLDVINNGAQHTAAFRLAATGWGVELGGINAIAGAGSVQANSAANGNGTLYLNGNGGSVGIGLTNPAFKLDVDGDIGLTKGANPAGPLAVSHEAAGAAPGYYANYAP